VAVGATQEGTDEEKGMDSDAVLSRIRKKRLSQKALLWFARGIIFFFRVFFRGLEFVSLPEQRQRLRQLREKMDGISKGGKVAIDQIQKGQFYAGVDAMSDAVARFGGPDDKEGFEETRTGILKVREESNALQAIHREAGEDKLLAVQNFRKYLEDRPDSHWGYAYLGGALRQAGDLEGSIAAYQQVIQLAEEGSKPADNARLLMGKVFQDKGDVQAAIREFKRIINDASPETESEVCLAFLSLGDALNEIGERGESRIAWKEAIRWDAYKIVAKKAKERLKANL